MRILVTGAGGFLGSWIAREAAERGHFVRAMVRSTVQAHRYPSIEPVLADLTDPASLSFAVAGMESVIHCAAATSAGRVDSDRSYRINVRGTRTLLEAAAAAGVARWLQISSMSAHEDSRSVYGRTKFAADEVIRESVPPPVWTILRPDLIYGPGNQGLVSRTISLLRRLPVVPVVGPGMRQLRPVFVADVARAALTALAEPRAAGQTFMLGGADKVSLDDFFRRLCRAAGLARPLVHIPIPLAYGIARLFQTLLASPPLNVDNVLGIDEGRPAENSQASSLLNHVPIGLDEGLRRSFES